MHDDKPSSSDVTPLAAAVARGDVAGIRRVLAGTQSNDVGIDGAELLIAAIAKGDLDAARVLLDGGADPNRAGKGGETAVHAAAFVEDSRFLELVLAHRGDANVRNTITGEAPIARAILGLHSAQVRRLLAAGADVNAADRNGNAPLHTAGSVNAGGVILALLDAGAQPMAKNARGDTFQPYYFQVRRELLNERALAERRQVVEWLRRHGTPLEAVVEP